MKLDKAKQELQTSLEKLGYRVYLTRKTVRLVHPRHPSYGVETHTYREAYRLAKGVSGNGKTVRPANRIVKEVSKGIIRTKIREQINAGSDDVHYPPKLACDPWSYD